MDRKIFYSLVTSDKIRVGRERANPKPEICLKGIGIEVEHAYVAKEGGIFNIIALNEDAKDNILVNGKKIDEGVNGIALSHNDRVIFGSNSFFIFKEPTNEGSPSMQDTEEDPITFEKAERERIEQ